MRSPSLTRPEPPPPWWLASAWLLVAALPVAYIATQVAWASRNVAFWDELDSAIDLLIQMNRGIGWQELLHRLFRVTNEHRTFTSRALFALSYWTTGTVNFHVVGIIGNLFLVGAGALLVAAGRSAGERIRLVVLLAFGLYHLGQFENFLWSGASIDHFQVVFLVLAAGVGLARGTRAGLGVAAIFGLLATFTLAHGTLAWPLGALWLWGARRWRDLAAWLFLGVLAFVIFVAGFELNTGNRIPELNAATFLRLGRYWLTLLGAPLTFGRPALAGIPGLLLLAGLGWLAWRGVLRARPVAAFAVAFAVTALGLVALGRSELAGGEVNSRYLILGSLAWVLVLHLAMEDGLAPARPFLVLAAALPALAAFNVAANLHYHPQAETFVALRDRAATRFMQYSQDGKGISRMHPKEGHAEIVLKQAAARGVYRLPRPSREVPLPARIEPNARMVTAVDELLVNEQAVTIGGWAMLPGVTSERGRVYVLLRSARREILLSTVTLPRPDVAQAYGEPRWRLGGFRAVLSRERLPAEDFQVVLVVRHEGRWESGETQARLELARRGDVVVPSLMGRD